MFEVEVFSSRPAIAAIPASMPLNVLLALPEYVTESKDAPFNLPAAINDLMGRAGWERATSVMTPYVWAPGWKYEQLREFVLKPFGNKGRDFPEAGLKALRADSPFKSFADKFWGLELQRYDIIHLMGRPGSVRLPHSYFGKNPYAHEEYLFLGEESGGMMAGALRDALVASGTRLLILQVPADEEEIALRLARRIVEASGPAVLVVADGGQVTLSAYFLNLYAEIVHNRSLSEVADPGRQASSHPVEDISLHLFMGTDCEDLLRLEFFAERIHSRIDRCRQIIEATPILSKLHEVRALLPRSQVRNYRFGKKSYERVMLSFTNEPMRSKHVAAVLGAAFDLSRELTSLDTGLLDWTHESGAALPVSEAAEVAPVLENSTENVRKFLQRISDVYPEIGLEIQNDLDEMARRAPRVLNANFADPQSRELIAPHKALVAERAYDLLVDVGPRWSSISSIVKGNGDFPEQALPPDQEGYLIKVVLISSDFQIDSGGDLASGEAERADLPREPVKPSVDEFNFEFDLSDFGSEKGSPGALPCVATAWMWIPRKTGRSFPYINGARNPWRGPVSLRVRAPKFPENTYEPLVTARGRLCLYFENNLLQSAMVKVSVSKSAEDEVLIEANEIEVDFVLTGSFQELDRFARREMRTGAETTTSYPVALNLTMNDDGAGGHRIIVEHGSDRLTRWIPYNTADARQMLEKTRELLLNCFWLKDLTTCKVETQPRQNGFGWSKEPNGKTFRHFLCDLHALAVQGSLLYNRVFVQSGSNATTWENELRVALAETALIQIPRTGSANYAYPWALLYDIPLPDYKVQGGLRWCDVLKQEWPDPEGVRSGPIRDRCPHQDKSEHQVNTLCPYGFWGLKHHIEQPINPVCQTEEEDFDLMRRKVLEEIQIDASLALSVGVTRDPSLNSAAIHDHLGNIQRAAAFVPLGGADDLKKVTSMLESSDLAYFLCHGMYDSNLKEPYLGVGPNDNDYQHRVYPNDLVNWARSLQGRLWADRHPLIFINGCHTSDLKPDEVLNFVSTFGAFGASGVIGTEVSVQLPLAIEIAEGLLSRLIKGVSVSHALRQVRWELVNKGNLLGLVYTPYCMTNLHIAANRTPTVQ